MGRGLSLKSRAGLHRIETELVTHAGRGKRINSRIMDMRVESDWSSSGDDAPGGCGMQNCTLVAVMNASIS